MKVCSLYGAGYHYIPGTDICQKIGGYIRYENTYGFGENITAGPFTLTSGLNTRNNGAADYVNRVRAYITEETRQQTAYGTLRTYLNVGVNIDSPSTSNAGQSAGGFNANRAFIQIAGFTFGRATSYYDFYSAPATGYFAPPSSDNGDPGVTVAAYTAQLGNGLSTSLSFEDPASRRQAILNTSGAAVGAFYGTNSPRKVEFPDIIANLRIDQAWGSAQVMGAIHDASAGYYTGTGVGVSHPGDTTLGWAVGAGLKVNFPMFGPGDYLQAQFNYANGASRYVATSLGSQNAISVNGNSVGYGVVSDAIYTGTGVAGTQTGVNLTTSWGFNAAYEHFWTPSVRTSLYGSYFKTSYNAQANAALCAIQTFGLQASCNNNYGMWTIGSRSQWNVTKDFYVGLDTIYMKLNTASAGSNGLLGAAALGGSTAGGVYTVSDQSAWAVRFRAHRDIVP